MFADRFSMPGEPQTSGAGDRLLKTADRLKLDFFRYQKDPEIVGDDDVFGCTIEMHGSIDFTADDAGEPWELSRLGMQH